MNVIVIDDDYIFEQYLKRNPPKRGSSLQKRIHVSSKSSSKRRGIEFSISYKDIQIPEFCPYLGVKLTNTLGEGTQDHNPSLDRIDNTKGYVKGNIQVISTLANRMKSSASVKQLQEFAQGVLKRHPINGG